MTSFFIAEGGMMSSCALAAINSNKSKKLLPPDDLKDCSCSILRLLEKGHRICLHAVVHNQFFILLQRFTNLPRAW